MKTSVRWLLCGALALTLAPDGAGAFKRTEVGDPLRDFALESWSGEPVRRSKHRGAKATVVVFWAAWSPRSGEILADLQALYAAHGPESLRVVAVNVERQSWDPAEAAQLAEAFRKAGATYP
ncbi:MAG: TlpA disulfide reductase family protein, partial [Deferrisomatales bacterium]